MDKYHGLDVIELLLDRWEINEPVDYDLLITQAMKCDNIDIIKYLVENAYTLIDCDKLMPVTLEKNSIDMVKLLLAYGADPIGDTVLILATKYRCQAHIIKLLLEYHDPVSHQDLIIRAVKITLEQGTYDTVGKLLMTHLCQSPELDFLNIAIELDNEILAEQLIRTYQIEISQHHLQSAAKKNNGPCCKY